MEIITIRNEAIWKRWLEYLKKVGYEGKEDTALANLINFYECEVAQWSK